MGDGSWIERVKIEERLYCFCERIQVMKEDEIFKVLLLQKSLVKA